MKQKAVDISTATSDDEIDLDEEPQKTAKSAPSANRLTRNRDITNDKDLLTVTYAQKCMRAAVCNRNTFPDPEETSKMLIECYHDAEDRYNYEIDSEMSYDRLVCVDR